MHSGVTASVKTNHDDNGEPQNLLRPCDFPIPTPGMCVTNTVSHKDVRTRTLMTALSLQEDRKLVKIKAVFIPEDHAAGKANKADVFVLIGNICKVDWEEKKEAYGGLF
jgi:hypothetical protein